MTWSSARFPARVLLVLWLVSSVGCSQHRRKPEPVEDVSFKVRMASSLVNAGRVTEALSTLDEAIAQEPDNGSLYNFYGQICFLGARYDEAERALLRALELDPYLTDAHNNLGAVYDKQGRQDLAELEFQRTVADPAYPTPEKAHLNLGMLYASQGRDREAIESLRRAVQTNPRYYRAHYELALLLERTSNFAEAASEYEVAEPDYRQDGEYWYRRGFTYYRLGQEDKAVDNLTRVRVVSPGSDAAARADQLLETLD